MKLTTFNKQMEREICGDRDSNINLTAYAMIAEVDGKRPDAIMTDASVSRTELDSHANMIVVGKNCYIIGLTGETMDVSPFTLDYESLKKVSWLMRP